MNMGPEYSEDDEATLPKVRKPTRPFSLLIVNYPARLEDNPASVSLSVPQMSELFGIRDGEMGFNLSHSNPQPKATAKSNVCHTYPTQKLSHVYITRPPVDIWLEVSGRAINSSHL